MAGTCAVVLGCGMVGATMAKDLAADDRFSVIACDVEERNLEKLAGIARITPRKADVTDERSLRKAIADADVVLGALPSRFGFDALRTIVDCGKRYADISFMPQDAMQLDALAKRRGAVAVVDCGVSPGLSNMAIGYAAAQLSVVHNAVIYVGGLPRSRQLPFQYKAPFAPLDVIEEYTRPARLIERGEIVVKPALSEPELVDVDGVGTLEAFNTDGLRSLLTTVRADFMREKTLRYPGHRDLMLVLRDMGLFSQERIDVAGVVLRPLDLTAKLMFPSWKLEPEEREFTVMRVVVDGVDSIGAAARIRFELFDEFDARTQTTSMARTTAFPCAIIARMLAYGEIEEPGVHPPERIAAQPGLMDRMQSELRQRNVTLTRTMQKVEPGAS